jgi:hypothetical protein
LHERIVRLEGLLEQFSRECAAMQPLDPKRAEHFSETCHELRGMIERLKAQATRGGTADERPSAN